MAPLFRLSLTLSLSRGLVGATLAGGGGPSSLPTDKAFSNHSSPVSHVGQDVLVFFAPDWSPELMPCCPALAPCPALLLRHVNEAEWTMMVLIDGYS